jgi:hypothetical protein
MPREQPFSPSGSSRLTLPILLSATHILLFALTMVSAGKTASEGNAQFCADLPVSLPLVANGDNWTMGAVGALATAWWYFIGHLGMGVLRGRLRGLRASIAASALYLCRRLIRDDQRAQVDKARGRPLRRFRLHHLRVSVRSSRWRFSERRTLRRCDVPFGHPHEERGYSSSSFTSPRSAFAFSMIFSCS